MGRHVTHKGDTRNPYNILVVKPEGKGSLVSSRHGWEDNVRMDLEKLGWEGVR
jgi:hypothetical protein